MSSISLGAIWLLTSACCSTSKASITRSSSGSSTQLMRLQCCTRVGAITRLVFRAGLSRPSQINGALDHAPGNVMAATEPAGWNPRKDRCEEAILAVGTSDPINRQLCESREHDVVQLLAPVTPMPITPGSL